MKQYIKQIKTYVKENPIDTARIIVIIFFLGSALFALNLSFAYETDPWVIADVPFGRFLAHILINIAPELAGLIIGVVTIDYLNERRQDEQLKRQLILQMGSKHNDVTDTAVSTLVAYGWLHDGTLEKAKLLGANLNGINLEGANLEGANLEGVDFTEANLSRANLKGTVLDGSLFVRANLWEADLTDAWLKGANLKGAIFSMEYGIDETAISWEMNLEIAKTWIMSVDPKKLRKTIMPDERTYEEWMQDKRETLVHENQQDVI